MKKKIIIALGCIMVLFFGYSYSNLEVGLIPKFRPFGNSTTLTDSTNYVNLLGKGLNVPNDSVRIGKDLYVGVKGGKVYLDTNRQIQLYVTDADLFLKNTKSINPTMNLVIGNNGLSFAPATFNIQTTNTTLFELDSVSGITLNYGDIQLTPGTRQVKFPSDTASDYDANDAVTINRQSGTITTKSLTTTAGNLYALTLTNSLITASTKIFASLNDGTVSQGLTILYQCRPGSGSGTIVIYNGHASQAFNGTVKIYFFLAN